jgi:DNA polymerase III sliding clamp (beta) subunit (PCNA family)
MMTLSTTTRTAAPAAVLQAKHFVSAVKFAQGALPRTDPLGHGLDLYQYIRLQASPGRMVLQSAPCLSDARGLVEVEIPCECEGAFDRTVNPAFFRRVVNIADSETVRISIDEGVTVEAGGLECRHGEANTPVMLPEYEGAFHPEIWQVDCEALLSYSIIKRALACVSKEPSRYRLNGALIDIEGGVVRLISTDGRRVLVRIIAEGVEAEDCICFMHANQLQMIASVLKADTMVRIRSVKEGEAVNSDGYGVNDLTSMEFEQDGVLYRVYTSSQINYPAWRRIMPTGLSEEFTCDSDDLYRKITKIVKVEPPESIFHSIEMHANGRLELTGLYGDNANIHGEPYATAQLPCELRTNRHWTSNPPVVNPIHFNPRWALDFLGSHKRKGEVKIKFSLDSAHRPFVMQMEEGEIYAVMPLRPAENPRPQEEDSE